VLGRAGPDAVAVSLTAEGVETSRETVPSADLPAWVAAREAGSAPRWVWSDCASWYAPLLDQGVRVARCHDLRLSHAILRASALVPADADVRATSAWELPAEPAAQAAPTLFDLEEHESSSRLPSGIDDAAAEFSRQQAALRASADPARLRLLLAAESAGGLIAAELSSAGLPWDAREHDRLLTEVLGPRPRAGAAPVTLEAAAQRVRHALGDPTVSLDSQPKLLRALHRAGVPVASTSRWELAEQQHPVIEPLLEYKKLSRLLSANGWAWLDEWVHDGRFRPVYVPGGVVTGRWASSGGGALQLPRQLRSAVRADPGWTLVVADVAQLEPRVLAALAADRPLAEAARGRDLYEGIVRTGVTGTRAESKIAMLGAMYGATTGDSGRLVPRLRRAFPRAMALVDEAARVGEDGGVVSTRLGRSCPPPSRQWRELQGAATEAGASAADAERARRFARDRGRFTRNFVVQGTAAEWALAWLADLRTRLALLAAADGDEAPRSGPAFSTRPHLAFFLHDEVIIHTPRALADSVADATRESAAAAGRLLFPGFPIDFPLDLRIVDSAEK
jgi:DNA polymerase-1